MSNLASTLRKALQNVLLELPRGGLLRPERVPLLPTTQLAVCLSKLGVLRNFRIENLKALSDPFHINR